MRKILLAVGLAIAAQTAWGQSAVIRGEVSPGVYANIKADASGNLVTAASATLDPCLSSGVAKSTAIISITTATTTQLVALSGTTIVYVCSVSMTISQVVTTANTIKFVYGTGASCGTGTADITGAFGTGGVTAAPPLSLTMGFGGTVFKNIAANALCATTTIGGSAAFVGVLTYVQQ